ncbi:MAG: hypothetical protein JWN12_388 [Candidatus Saccharibacteria bacterium]|nr:hypothetical protein [Candidatus Saccharibacteria bacterium]
MMESNYVKGKYSVLTKQRIRKSVGMVTVAAFAFALLFSSQTFAQAATTSTNVIKASPVRTDIQIEPGSVKTVQMTITNLTNAPITVSPIENDFISADEKGTPALILDANTYAPTHSLKRFLTKIPDTTIPANKSVTINVVITVPAGTQAGGYFGAVRFAPTSPSDGGQVNLSPNVASIILLTVPGPTTELLNLTNFDVQQNSHTGTTFQNPDNLSVLVRFENKGNIQEGPFGKISVKNGKKIVYETDFNVTDPRDQILPDGARRWDVPLKSIGTFGYYTVTGTLTYGQKNTTIDISKSFWVIPQSYIIGAIIALVVLIGLIIFIVFFIRSRMRRRLRNRMNGNSRYRR